MGLVIRFRSIPPVPPPWLEFVAAGGQSRVFGTDSWVLKIPRRSWRTALGRILVHPATPARALDVLGGVLEPFVLLRDVAFAGPRLECGRPVPGSVHLWRTRWAVASARLEAGQFLDHRIARASPGEAADLISALLDTLAVLRARGWHLLDFIMSNFAVGTDGRVRLVDAGLLIPAGHLRGPSHQICSRLFVRRLGRDYRQVLAGVASQRNDDAHGAARLQAVVNALEPRLHAWRAGRLSPSDAEDRPAPAAIDPALLARIFEALGPARLKMPLTRRLPSGYTPPHHAITSEN